MGRGLTTGQYSGRAVPPGKEPTQWSAPPAEFPDPGRAICSRVGGMLKTRIIGVILVKDGIAVQSIGFRRYLPIGQPEIAIEYLNRWGIDEIVLLHIDAWMTGGAPTAEQVASYARQCQVPLTVGGGLASLTDVRRIIQAGADKVAINTA